MALSVSDITDVSPKVDEQPMPLKAPAPAYPETLRREGVSGVVLITLVIDEHGSVIASEVKKSSNEAFSTPALEAVASWKFKPARLGDKSVKVRVTIPIRFNVSWAARSTRSGPYRSSRDGPVPEVLQ